MESCSCSTLFAIFMTGVTLLFILSNTVAYFVKMVFFCASSMVCATAPVPLMLRRPKDYRNALIPAWGCRMSARLMGLTYETRGVENAVKDTGAVMLINHQSILDLVVLAYLWPIVGRCTVISKREIFYAWPFGLAVYLWGTIFINRNDKQGAKKRVNDTAHALHDKKAKLCMFPEGTRHQGPTLLPFKKGAFHVAISNQCPVMPVVVNRYYWLNDKSKKFDPGHNIITMLPSIPTKGLTLDDIDALMQETYASMSQCYKKINEEIAEMRETKYLKQQ